MRKFSTFGVVAALLAITGSNALAVDAAQDAIVASGATIATLAGAAGAAGVAIMVVIYGIRVASRALKAPK